MTVKMHNTYADDGSFTIVFSDGVVLGPYGPGRCAATHSSGLQCNHMNNHVGCHSADDETTAAGEFKHRWYD